MKPKCPWVDVLRIAAICGIVGCHLDLPNMTAAAKCLNRLSDFNVAVFAILSGHFFFLSVEDSAKAYLKKRIRRIFVPYMIWSVVYFVVSMAFHALNGRGVSASDFTLERIMDMVFWGGTCTHLWFIATLFYVQILLLPIKLYKDAMSNKLFLIALFLLSLGIVVFSDLTSGWWAFYPFRLLGFFILGMFMCEVCRRNSISWGFKFISLLPCACGVIGICFGLGHLVLCELLIAAPLCYIAISTPCSVSDNTVVSLRKLGELTFLVYLVHPLFTVAQRELVVRLFAEQTASVFLADQIVAFVLSFIAAVFLARGCRKV